ncbi:nucleoredoxin [Centrocercus urophasianus]|uniref:nucleoredoxin n=1 Tax=Centrocercus urophasianus TaxID=9002 RepID=UPI001C645C02|nr:nucleoredoxin [Centrocercus urophasianus]XP_042735765.1 nucleoredoxin [Lagopus leucura]XP_048822570.1 nucleoredoxin [Lagopus muta]XP_052544598.1 nucleoredoxin [Tympanuchus pallidicinctus]
MAGALAEVLGEVLVSADGEEVAVSALAARGVSLVGLYFGCSLSGPCAQLGASLAAFYGRFRGEAAAASGAQRLEIVFVSAEQEQQQWQEAVRAMPWLALPFAEKHRKLKLWNKYRVSNIPSLIFIDASTGKVVCRNGLLVIRDDPEGLEFPWGPKPFSEVVAGPLLRNNGQTLDSSALEGSHVGVYFSAHWCPPCRSLTRVLVESYRKIKEAGQKFEILFVSADRSEDSFKQYFSEMPWVAVPYADEARRSRLNRLYGIQGIPTLIVLDSQGEVITRQGRVEVLNDIECREFPWHPKPVLELTDSNAVQLNEGPCLVLFVDSEDDGESEAAKQLIQPIAEKIIAKYKAKEEEAPLLFFVAGEDDMTDSLRDYTNLPEAAPLLTILDMSARAKYVMDVEEITPEIVEAFVSDFLADKLKPEPI